MCKGQEERERGTEVPRSKRNKKCTGRSGKSGRSFAISAIFASANYHKERHIRFVWKRRKGGVGQMQGMENERKRWFAQLNEFPRFV